MTIDQAITALLEARAQMGGDKCLILSLTDSEIQDADVDTMEIVSEDESQYVQISCHHPELLRALRRRD